MFQFINLDQTGATGKPVLCEVDITYPDDADMDTVKKEMEKSYGSSKDSITRYELYQSLGDDQLPEYTYKKADQLAVWSGESLKDAIPSDKSTEYETAWEAYQPGLTATTGRATPNRQAWQPPYAHPAQKHFQCLKKTVSASKLIRDWYMSR